MSGFIAGAMVVSAGASMYAADQANQAADARAATQNANNMAAHERSLALSERDAQLRRDELLRRFNIKADKVSDTQSEIDKSLAINLTSFDLQLASAQSMTDNALATKHITGRLAERLRNAQVIGADMQRDTMIQGAEAQHKQVGNTLENMRMNYETEEMNLGIDLSNAINTANNQLVAGTAYSSSTGTVGVITSGIQGAASGASLGATLGG